MNRPSNTLMVPLIFQAYATDMAQRVAAFSPGAVLETAAGSGAVTRALVPRLGADARYVVTDLNQPILDYAAIRQGSDSRIEWRQADALGMLFPHDPHDPHDPPRFLARTPHGYHDVALIREDLSSAG